MSRFRPFLIALLLAVGTPATAQAPDGVAPLGPLPVGPTPAMPSEVVSRLLASHARQAPIATILRLQEALALSLEQVYQPAPWRADGTGRAGTRRS